MYIYNIGERSINRSATRLTGLARGLLRHFVRVCEPVFNGRISTVFNGRIKTFHHMIWFLRAHTSECARQHSCSPPASAPTKEWIYFRFSIEESLDWFIQNHRFFKIQLTDRFIIANPKYIMLPRIDWLTPRMVTIFSKNIHHFWHKYPSSLVTIHPL